MWLLKYISGKQWIYLVHFVAAHKFRWIFMYFSNEYFLIISSIVMSHRTTRVECILIHRTSTNVSVCSFIETILNTNNKILPNLLVGFLLNNARKRLWASGLRNWGMPNLALKIRIELWWRNYFIWENKNFIELLLENNEIKRILFNLNDCFQIKYETAHNFALTNLLIWLISVNL